MGKFFAVQTILLALALILSGAVSYRLLIVEDALQQCTAIHK